MQTFQTLEELAQFFIDQATSSGSITLDDAILSPRVLGLLETHLDNTGFDLVVDPTAIPTDPQDTLVFPATTPSAAGDSFLNLEGKTVPTITFTLVPDGGVNEVNFVIEIELGDWTFGTSFDQLAFLPINDLQSALSAQTLHFTTLPNGDTLTYASSVALDGDDNPIGTVLQLIPDAPTSASLSGAITATDDGPAFDLHAPLLPNDFTLGGLLTLQAPRLGVRATYIPPLDEAQEALNATSTNYVGAGIAFTGNEGSLTLLFEAVIYTSGGYAALTVRPENPTEGSIENLVSLVGDAWEAFDGLFSTDFAAQFKDDFFGAVGFLSFTANYAYSSSKLTYLLLRLGSVTDPSTGQPKQWVLFGGALKIDFELQWTIFDPLGARTMAVALLANIEIAGLPFEVQVDIPGFIVSGRYAGEPVSLIDAINNILADDANNTFEVPTIPTDIAQLDITGFNFLVDPQSKSFNFTLAGDAGITLFGTRILAVNDAVVSLARSYADENNPTLTLTFDGFIGIGELDFEVHAVISNEQDTEFQINMVDQTVGSLLQYLISLVDPYYELSMEAPWNALLDLSLDALVLKVNVTQGIVYVTYSTEIDLGFITITALSLVYKKAEPATATEARKPSSVQIALDCTLLGKSYSGDDALAWDPMNENPPPATGPTPLFELNYLGLGQHVTPTNDETTMEGIIRAMQEAMVPADDSQNPAQLPGIRFSAESSWLIAAKFSLMRAVSITAIFNDPNLYGIRIGLSGSRVGVLSGLVFEILYKKVTDSIGLYHIELTLPDAMRQLDFGSVSITLPVIAIDIFTNGDFKIDVGFPVGLDFSRSASVQVFPFIGYGGFYFAKLSGATSSRVPQITNGTFDPVLEFGLALSIGVGKTINKGVLQAGLSITVVGILEGVLAWFEPDDQDVQDEMYYYVQGTIAIVGKLYGKVDFEVIKVNVEVVAYASARLTVESYEPILIELEAGVSVKASVKVAFVKIDFSFKTTIYASFTIGDKGKPPWIEGTQSNNTLATPTTNLAATPAAVGGAISFALSSASVAALTAENAPEIQTLDLILTPAFTITSDPSATVQCVLLPFIENAIPTNGTASDNAADKPFNQFVSRLLAWTIDACMLGDDVTADELDTLHAKLNEDSFQQEHFTYQALTADFLTHNFVLRFDARDAARTDELSGTIFPIPPPLTLTANGTTVNFAEHTPVSDSYLETIDTYLDQLQVDYENSVEQEVNDRLNGAGDGPTTPSAATAADDPSMATVVFRNYFLMLARYAAQAAIDLLKEFPYTVELDNQSPPKTKSLEAISVAFGGIDEASIVTANQSAAVLASGATVRLNDVVDQAGAGDSFTKAASRFAGVDASTMMQLNAADPILSSGIALDFSALTTPLLYTAQSGDTPARVAAFFTVRLADPSTFNLITGLNTLVTATVAANGSQFTADELIPAGTSITVPLSSGDVQRTATHRDTITRIAAMYLAVDAGVFDLSTLIQGLIDLNSLPQDATAEIAAGTSLQIPAFTYTTRSSDTLDAIKDLFGAPDVTALAPVVLGIEGLPIPRAVLKVPPFDHTIADGDTFQSIANTYGLTLDTLTTGIQSTTGLFVEDAALILPNIPSMAVPDLLSALLNNGDFNTAAGMVSRFMLHGLRLPLPTATAPLTAGASATLDTGPLYDLIGQQFPLPATLPDPFALTVSENDNDGDIGWIELGSGGSSDDLAITLNAAERTRVSQLQTATFSPNVERLHRLPLFREIPTRDALQKDIAWVAAAPPAGTCLAETGDGGSALTIWPFPTTLQDKIDALPESALVYELKVGTRETPNKPMTVRDVGCYVWGTMVNFGVKQVPVGGDDEGLANGYLVIGADEVGRHQLQEVWDYLNQAPNADASLYLLYRPDPTSSDANGLVSDALVNVTPTPPPEGEDPPQETFLLKTNLSTLSQSGPPEGVALMTTTTSSDEDAFHASLYNTADFIRLLWEISVVHSGGFYLNYATPDGDGLPGHLFNKGPVGSLTLLILIDDPDDTAKHPQIHGMHNCAVVRDTIDAANDSVFVQPITYIVGDGDTLSDAVSALASEYAFTTTPEALAEANKDIKNLLRVGATVTKDTTDHTVVYGDTFARVAAALGTSVADLATQNKDAAILEAGALLQLAEGQLQTTATASPGVTGFTMTRPDPDPNNDESSIEEVVGTLFQLLGYCIKDNGTSAFVSSGEGLPAGPQDSDHDATDGVTIKPINTGDIWTYKQTLPVFMFAKAGDFYEALLNDDTYTAYLPSPALNPYRGIAPSVDVQLAFDFQDIYGNRAAPATPLPDLTIPVGYTDDLIGLDQWPSVAATYLITENSGQPAAAISLAFEVSPYVTGPETTYELSLKAAAARRERYKQLFYQIHQPDLAFLLRTSLDQPAADTLTPYPVDKQALTNFVGATYLFLSAAGTLLAHKASGDTLQDLADAYFLGVPDLARTNATTDVTTLFEGTTLIIPQFYIFKYGDTIQATGIEAAQLEAGNADVLLAPGIDIGRAFKAGSYTVQTGDTLRTIARAVHADAGPLGEANKDHPLKNDLTLRIQDPAQDPSATPTFVSLITGAADTLATMATRFQTAGLDVTAAEIAKANQDIADLFTAGDLTVNDYVIQEGDTLAALKDLFDVDDLAGLISENEEVVNLFPAGTALLKASTAEDEAPVSPGDTLTSIARDHSVSVDALANANATAALKNAATLLIPNQVDLDSPAPPHATYPMQTGETLAAVAAAVGAAQQEDLVGLNRTAPALFAETSGVTIGPATIDVETEDTFESLYQKVLAADDTVGFATFAADFVAANAATNLIRPNALFICPPIQVNTGESLAALAQRYRCDIAGLMQANRSVRNLLQAGSFTYESQTVDLGANDTFLTLASRFTDLGIPLTVEAMASLTDFTGATTLLRPDSLLVPPPPPASLTIALAQTANNPEKIFPLTVILEMERGQSSGGTDPLAFVDPDFADVEAVRLTSTPITPHTSDNGSGATDPARLTQFAEAFEEAYGGLKVAVGRPTATTGDTKTRQAWVVDFRNDDQCSLTDGLCFNILKDADPTTANPNARYFALPPLATTLISQRDVPLKTYVRGTGLGETTERSFQAVDLDVWMRDFLAAVDLFLSPSFAIRAFELDPDVFAEVVGYKSGIADWLTANIIPVLHVDWAPDEEQAALAEAQEALKQRLLIELSNAYTIETIVQVPVTVASPFSQEDNAPRLSGKPVATDNGSSTTATYSLSTAKVPLVNGQSYLNFLVDIKDENGQNGTDELALDTPNLNLDLRYSINEIEYDIGAVAGIEDYQASSWLTLIRPIGADEENPTEASTRLTEHARIGPLNIPIPLRAYPTPPSMVLQNGPPDPVDPDASLQDQIMQLKTYDYGTTFEHAAAPQDTRYLKVRFNGPSDTTQQNTTEAADVDQALFTALAQFMTVYPDLKNDLGALPLLEPGTENATVAAAIATFGSLAQQVHTAMTQPLAGLAAFAALPTRVYEYKLETRPGTTDVLRVTAVDPDQWPKVPAAAPYLWPEIYAQVYDGTAYQSHQLLPPDPIPENTATIDYAYPADPPSLIETPRYQFVFADRDITRIQNGLGGVWITRNENLGTEANPVDPAFVYQTPIVRFPNPFTPLIIHTEIIEIRETTGDDLKTALENLFRLLLFESSMEPPIDIGTDPAFDIQVSCRYGYELVTAQLVAAGVDDDAPTTDALITYLPVLLLPRFALKQSEATTFADALSTELTTWQARHNPSEAHGGFYIDIHVYSSLDLADTQPLLEIKNFRYLLAP